MSIEKTYIKLTSLFFVICYIPFSDDIAKYIEMSEIELFPEKKTREKERKNDRFFLKR
jgi:hypothetical protein